MLTYPGCVRFSFLQYRIRNYPLLIKTAVVMFVVILLFFLHSIPQMNISLGKKSLLSMPLNLATH